MTGGRATFLGSGDSFCPDGRHQASYLLRGDERSILLDCGATALASLRREGVDPASIDAVLLSHLHGDHFAGLGFLLLEYMFGAGRQRPLVIAGPPGTEARIWRFAHALYEEMAGRPPGFPLRFVEMDPGTPVEIDGLRIDPFRVPHQERGVSLGLKVRFGRATVVYSGDTGWTDELLRQAADSDLFICECSFFETRAAHHLDYPRIAEHQAAFGTRRLVLTHLGREVLARRREVEVELAHDGLSVDLP